MNGLSFISHFLLLVDNSNHSIKYIHVQLSLDYLYFGINAT